MDSCIFSCHEIIYLKVPQGVSSLRVHVHMLGSDITACKCVKNTCTRHAHPHSFKANSTCVLYTCVKYKCTCTLSLTESASALLNIHV